MTQTPFEQHPRTTTLAEETAFLEALATANPKRLAIDVVGHSVNGHPIRLLRVGATTAPRAGQVSPHSCLWVGLQHGEEAQGREAALTWARDLAETTDPTLLAYLAQHPALILPTCNPDSLGIKQFNANNVNLNRDHFKLSQPETLAIHRVIRTYEPQIIHDMHTGGVADMELQGAVAAAVDPGIKTLSADLRDTVLARLQAAGVGTAIYPGSGAPLTSEARMLRDAAGVLNSIGLLSEVRSWVGNPAVDPPFPVQLAWYMETIRGVAAWHAEHGAECADTIAAAKARSTRIGAQAAEPFSLGLAGGVIPVPPAAYWLRPAQYATLAEKLRMLGITATRQGQWWVVPMGQAAMKAIPYALDPQSSEATIPARRIGLPIPTQANIDHMVLRSGNRDHPIRMAAVIVDGTPRVLWQNL